MANYPITSMADSSRGPHFFLSTRFVLSVVGFIGFINLYQQRFSLSVAIVCMQNHTYLREHDTTSTTAKNTSVAAGCEPLSTSADADGEFQWTKSEQGLVLGSFFWGYITTQILGGQLSERYGAKYVFLGFMSVCTVLTLLTPLLASSSLTVFIVVRVLIGIAQGVAFPSMHSLWSRWAPPAERTILAGLTYVGADMGSVLTFPVAAALCSTDVGWPLVFYVSGAFSVVWCVLWFLLVGNTPRTSRMISQQERKYIETSLTGQIRTGHELNTGTPWVSILTSVPVWASMVVHTAENFGYYLVLLMMPSYMNEVLLFDINSNGLFAALPSIANLTIGYVTSVVADFVRKRRFVSTTFVRKFCNFFSLMGQGTLMVAAGYCSCHYKYLGVTLIVLSQGFTGLRMGGYMVNHIDLAPRYGGTLFGISNTFSTISGFIVPVVASQLTPNRTLEEWRNVFWVSFGVLSFGAVFYTLFGSAELQPWAKEVDAAEQETKVVEINLTNNINSSD